MRPGEAEQYVAEMNRKIALAKIKLRKEKGFSERQSLQKIVRDCTRNLRLHELFVRRREA